VRTGGDHRGLRGGRPQGRQAHGGRVGVTARKALAGQR
jgi:hypothetical protein